MTAVFTFCCTPPWLTQQRKVPQAPLTTMLQGHGNQDPLGGLGAALSPFP